jgi:predicted acyl esterase
MQLPHARDLPFVDREGGRTVDEISGKSFSKHWVPMSAFSGEVSATVVTSFPNEIEEIEHTWVPLSDGTRLAARLWRPIDANTQPVPAILEYIPYCKRDGTAARDEAIHPFFAGHGFVAVRVDMRGSGESDGIMHDEYLAVEQDNALEVIAWIAAQAWCDGQIGMMGKSWRGLMDYR